MGNPLPPQFVKSQYRIVLDKVATGELKTPERTLLTIVMKDRHVFRGGTAIGDDTDRREYYTDLIETCKAERGVTTPNRATSTRARKPVKRIDLIGRRVIMSADVFGGKVYEAYHGVVTRKCRYRQRGKLKYGYVVKWHDDDEDMW